MCHHKLTARLKAQFLNITCLYFSVISFSYFHIIYIAPRTALYKKETFEYCEASWVFNVLASYEKADSPKAVSLKSSTHPPLVDALVLLTLPLMGWSRHSLKGEGARLWVISNIRRVLISKLRKQYFLLHWWSPGFVRIFLSRGPTAFERPKHLNKQIDRTSQVIPTSSKSTLRVES